MKWYQDGEGNVSSMRIIAMLSGFTGCIAVLAGVAGMFAGIPESVAIAGTGAGMAGLGQVSKAWQSRNEATNRGAG